MKWVDMGGYPKRNPPSQQPNDVINYGGVVKVQGESRMMIMYLVETV
jgi:hypothetical protein